MSTFPDIALERGLPASPDAERAILGGILLNNPHFQEAAAAGLVPEDFALESHRRIYEHMQDLITEGHRADLITLVESLAKRKMVESIGGVAYIASLTENLPRRVSIEEYVHIVRDKAMLRATIRTADHIATRATDQSEEPEAILADADALIREISNRAVTEGFKTPTEVIASRYESLDAFAFAKQRRGSVLTGWGRIDAMFHGLKPKELIIIAARPAMGKRQPLDAPVKTLSGWKRNGDLKVGDKLASVDGLPSEVVGIFPQGVHPMVRVTFSDGRSTECDPEHLWEVHCGRLPSSPQVMTTSEVARMMEKPRYKNRLWIETCSGDFGHDDPLPIDPWLLGALLGNGNFTDKSGTPRFSSRDEYTIEKVEAHLGPLAGMRQLRKYNYRFTESKGLIAALRSLELWNHRAEAKFIPESYLLASKSARLELLRGLIDTDGNVEKRGGIVYSTSSKRLADDVVTLARSLGALVTISERPAPLYLYRGEVRTGLPAYRVYISHPESHQFVSLPRKRERIKPKRPSRLTFHSIAPSRAAEAQCIAVSHPRHLYITNDYILTHNTAWAVNVASHVAIKQGKTVGIFSLEMSSESLLHRMASGIGRYDSRRRENSWLTEDEKQRMLAALGAILDSSLYIDDTGALTMLKLRARAHRLKQQHGALDLIMVDYLQLLDTGVKKENRTQEVSFISRGLKALAKELDVPVIALSQLNRANEQRSDKRPMLSDLRECVSGDTLVCLADGRRLPIRDLVGQAPDVWAVSDQQKIIQSKSDRVWKVGTRPVFDMRLTSGRVLRMTASHRILCESGWEKLGSVCVGARVAVSRRIPCPLDTRRVSDHELVLLGHMIGDGSYLLHRPLRYTTASDENSDAVTKAAELFGCVVRRHEGRGNWHQLVISGNGNRWRPKGVNAWLRSLGIFNQRSVEKRVPAFVFTLSDEDLGIFLRHLWATDGCIHPRNAKGSPRVYFSTASRGLAFDVAALLMRLGIVARVKAYASVYAVDINGRDSLLTFLRKVGAFGPRIKQAERLSDDMRSKKCSTNVDTLPPKFFSVVREKMRAAGITQRQMARIRGRSYGGQSHFRFSPSRSVAMEYARALKDSELAMWAESDIFWDSVSSITPAGEEEVFDLTVPGPANWLADGIVTHNSGAIEQDADVVAFLHRPEYYDKFDPELKGLAEFIIAKQREGPVGTVPMHYTDAHTRFDEMVEG